MFEIKWSANICSATFIQIENHFHWHLLHSDMKQNILYTNPNIEHKFLEIHSFSHCGRILDLDANICMVDREHRFVYWGRLYTSIAYI